MSKQVSVVTVKRDFDIALDGSLNLVAAVEPFCARNYESFSTNPLHFRQSRRVVALAFVWTLAAWETFIGDTFVRYLAGAKSPKGWAPQLALGKARSLQHAYELVSGWPGFDSARRFLNWTPEDLIRRSQLFLAPGNRIVSLVTKHHSFLDDGSVIRNRVVHSSSKSRAAFTVVARRIRGKKLHQSYSVGDLMLEPRPSTFPKAARGKNVFEAYVAFYRNLGDSIVP